VPSGSEHAIPYIYWSLTQETGYVCLTI